MPKQECVSRPPTPRSCRSIPAAASRHSPRTSARCWRVRSSVTLAVLLLAASACRTLRPATTDARVALRADLIRIEDTRRVDLASIDSALRSPDPSLRSAAALTVGRIGARERTGGLRTLATDRNAQVAAAALYALG